MAFLFDPIDPEEAVTAARVTTALDSFRTGFNAMEETSIQRRTLRSNQMPTLVGAYVSEDTATVDTLSEYAVFVTTNREVVLNGITGYQLGMARADRIAGLLVSANVNFVRSYDTGAPGDTGRQGVFAIQWQNAAGLGWTTIVRTTRFAQNDVGPAGAQDGNFDAAIRTLITPADVGTNFVSAVRLAFCGRDDNASVGAGNLQTRINNAQLSVIRIHAGGF